MYPELFVVPNSWFGVFEDVKPIIQVSLDGSYSRAGHPQRILSYAGLFGYEPAWQALVPMWRSAMPHDWEYFRTTEARARGEFSAVRTALGEACVRAGMKAIGVASRQELLTPESEAKRKHQVFSQVVEDLVAAMPPTVNLALLCDREQDLAKEITQWSQRASERNDPLYDRVAGICYLNSRYSIQIQAADLVAGLLREHAEQHEADPTAPMDPVLAALAGGRLKTEWRVKSVSDA